MKTFLWWMGWVWALPVTLAGWILAVFTAERVHISEGVALFTAREWFRVGFFHRFHVGAFCWGATVHIPGDVSVGTFRHELVHFKQARIFGILLPVAYGVGALWALARGGHPYRDNYFERQAREESGR